MARSGRVTVSASTPPVDPITRIDADYSEDPIGFSTTFTLDGTPTVNATWTIWSSTTEEGEYSIVGGPNTSEFSNAVPVVTEYGMTPEAWYKVTAFAAGWPTHESNKFQFPEE